MYSMRYLSQMADLLRESSQNGDPVNVEAFIKAFSSEGCVLFSESFVVFNFFSKKRIRLTDCMIMIV